MGFVEYVERDSATIGTVDSVSADRIQVLLRRDAPHGTSLANGELLRFPQVNGFVVLPSEQGGILAMVENIRTDPEPPVRDLDKSRLGLPTPARKLTAVPLGVLRRESGVADSGPPTWALRRGALVFPTVGDPVRIPTTAEAQAALTDVGESGLFLGRAPLAGGTELRVDADRLLGRHLAVLGNTGSGKSCSVAHIVRSAAAKAVAAGGRFRAVVFDINGEYGQVFDDLTEGSGTTVSVKHLTVDAEDPSNALRVPAWMWNDLEWETLSDPSAKTQAPVLREALALLRLGESRIASSTLIQLIAGGRELRMFAAGAYSGTSVGSHLSEVEQTIAVVDELGARFPEFSDRCERFVTRAREALPAKKNANEWIFNVPPLAKSQSAILAAELNDIAMHLQLPVVPVSGQEGLATRPWPATLLADVIQIVAAGQGPDVVGWTMPMVERVRSLFAQTRAAKIVEPAGEDSLSHWFEHTLGTHEERRITVVDLSLVPHELQHLIAAVLSRLLFEAQEQFRSLHQNGAPPPTMIVVEEAHTLIRKGLGANDGQLSPMAKRCRESFERIAREGRKFGLSMVVSSQRPSELSETVLSQCNTFLVHRIVNDSDQALVRRLVPDNVGSFLAELPALPERNAILMGWATDIPTLVEIAPLAELYRPRSADPQLANYWGTVGAAEDWHGVYAALASPDGHPSGKESEGEVYTAESRSEGGEGPEDDESGPDGGEPWTEHDFDPSDYGSTLECEAD